MKRTTRFVVAAGAALALLSAPAVFAQAPAGSTTPASATSASGGNSQQEKMKGCNADATTKGLKGDDRKSFMKDCLSAKPAAKPANSQQEKMKSCNADATSKGLKGDDRKSYMSNCLKGSGSGQ
jgi:hypothetical protein